MCVGKKQDLWYVVDLLTGEKQQTLTSSFAEMLCPSSSLLYLGRTGKHTQTKQGGRIGCLFPLHSSNMCNTCQLYCPTKAHYGNSEEKGL